MPILNSIRELNCKQIIELMQLSLKNQELSPKESNISESSASKVLYDLFCILKNNPNIDFKDIRIALIGNWCELFDAYLDLALYLPMELLYAIPEKSSINTEKLNLVLDLGAKVFVGHEINLALYKVKYLILSDFIEQKSQNLNESGFFLTQNQVSELSLLPSSKETNLKMAHTEAKDQAIFYQNLANIIGGKNENQ